MTTSPYSAAAGPPDEHRSRTRKEQDGDTYIHVASTALPEHRHLSFLYHIAK